MQMALAIQALQTRRHRQLQEGNSNPKTQVRNSEPGAPGEAARRVARTGFVIFAGNIESCVT
jgi:hypothetical protein